MADEIRKTEARKQIETIKSLTDSIVSQGFNSKFLSQNAKKYKPDCVSFANRMQNIGEKGKEFVKNLESEELEVAMIKYKLSSAVEALKNFQGLASNIHMFILQQQSPINLNRPNPAEDFRIQRLLVDYHSRLDDSIECLSVAFLAMQIQKPLSIEEQEELLRGLKADVEKELTVLEEIKSQQTNTNRTRWLELAIEHNHLRFIPYDQIVIDKFLKCGGFGIVYKAFWDDTPIVLKQLFNQTDFIEEIRLHKRVHDGDYIVKLHGITKDTDGNLGMIMKYTAHGDLRDYLKTQGNSLTWHQKIVLAKQIAIGLSFIHREKIMHR
ncbi:278_t:CDS:2, partial [Ambispora leptoticha]